MVEIAMNKSRLLLLLPITLALQACTQTSSLALGGAPGITVVPSSELPGPQGQTGSDQRFRYVIGPFDKLVVDVMGFEELNGRRIQVDGSGNIVIPMAGQVPVQGLTLGEASERIAAQLRGAYVRDPQVAVNMEEATSQYVTVEGEVEQPGNYPVVAEMTLMRAIAAARGTTEFARLNDVVIHRTVNGQRMVALYQLNAIRRGAYEDPILYPHDTVVVGDSPGRRLFYQILQITPILTSPLVAFLSNN